MPPWWARAGSIALDDDLARRLHEGDKAALQVWGRITRQLQFYEAHRDWRAFRPYGKLAVIQGVKDGALLSGGILDMIGARHTPVRAVPPDRLRPETLAGASMAVDVDAASLTPEQREVLKAFTRAGGTLLTGPADWKESAAPETDQITLDDKETKRLDDIWHDINCHDRPRQSRRPPVQCFLHAFEPAGLARWQAGTRPSGQLFELSRSNRSPFTRSASFITPGFTRRKRPTRNWKSTKWTKAPASISTWSMSAPPSGWSRLKII